MKLMRIIIIVIHFLVGIGAVGGGIPAVLNPNNPLGAPIDALKNSPFNNYLIPGIILLTVIGIGNLFAAVMALIRIRPYPYISGFSGAALVGWIVVQCIMLQAVAILHVIFFSIGVVLGLLSLYIIYAQKQFPFNMFETFSRQSK